MLSQFNPKKLSHNSEPQYISAGQVFSDKTICEFWKLNCFVNGFIDSIVGFTGTLTFRLIGVFIVGFVLLQQPNFIGVSDKIDSIPAFKLTDEFESVPGGNAFWYFEYTPNKLELLLYELDIV